MLLNIILNGLPPDIWHDALFLTILGSAVTLLAGIIGALVAYLIYHRQRSKKEIKYQVISDAPIISVDEAIASRVKITLDGEPITTEARLVVLKMWNSGNTAVQREDYDEPLVLKFDSITAVSWEVLETEPANLKISFKQSLPELATPPSFSSSITQAPASTQQADTSQPLPPVLDSIKLPKFLLNRGESVSLSILLKGEKSAISMTGRIINGNIVMFDPEKQPATLRAWQVIFIALYILQFVLLAILLTTYSSQISVSPQNAFLFDILEITGFAIVMMFLLPRILPRMGIKWLDED